MFGARVAGPIRLRSGFVQWNVIKIRARPSGPPAAVAATRKRNEKPLQSNDLAGDAGIPSGRPRRRPRACHGTGSCGTLCAMAHRSIERSQVGEGQKSGGAQGVGPASRVGWTVPGSRSGMEGAQTSAILRRLLDHGMDEALLLFRYRSSSVSAGRPSGPATGERTVAELCAAERPGARSRRSRPPFHVVFLRSAPRS